MTDEVPDRRKHGYVDLERKIDKHTKRIDERYHWFILRTLIAVAVIGLSSAAALAGFGVVLNKQREVAKDIQLQRYESIYLNCMDQNDRHDNALVTAERLGDEGTKRVVRALINSLQPRQADCDAFAESRVRGDPDVRNRR